MKKNTSERYQETYYQEQLDNGLEVILWQKPNYEKSLFMMVTPFGAVDLIQEDEDGILVHHPSGIAHFLEHKMFAMEGEDVMNLFSAMGANVNAFTSYHETAYYASTTAAPAPCLNLLLDFVQELHIDEESVEKEKGIIISELHMYKEMSDQRLLMEVYASLYQKHPLRLDIGGDDESVSQTTLEQLQRCYEMNYHPSRMILICVSGEDPETLMKIIKENQAKKQFKAWPNIKTISIVEPEEPARKKYEFTMDVSIPKVAVAYKLEGIKEPYERTRREWAIRLLLDANFTTLYPEYQDWLDQGIINDYCGSDIDIGEDYASLFFYAETNKTEEFIQLCEACIKRIQAVEITQDVLEQLKRRYYAQSIRSLNSFDDIAISFARSKFMGMDPFKQLDLLNDLTMQDVKQAAEGINSQYQSIVTLLPKK